jgi:hypothetical protein
MDHKTAARSLATERYILGELSPAERDEFEEHLSDCPECMEDVSTAEMFVANSRAVFADQTTTSVPEKKNRWLNFMRLRPLRVLVLSAVLNLVLLAVIGYGSIALIPSLKSHLEQLETPDIAEILVVHGSSRGDSQTFTISRSTRYCVLRFDLPHAYPHYSYSIQHGGALMAVQADSHANHPSSAPHTVRRSGTLDISAKTDTLNLTIPITSLKPGLYELQVIGSDDAGSKQIGKCVLSIVQ